MGQSNGKTWPLPYKLSCIVTCIVARKVTCIMSMLPFAKYCPIPSNCYHMHPICKKRSVQFHHQKEKSLSSKYQPNDQVKSQSSFVFLPPPPLLLPIEACRSKKIPLLCKSGSLDTAPSSVQTEQTQYLTKPQRLSVKRQENYGHFMNRDSRELLEINGLWP